MSGGAASVEVAEEAASARSAYVHVPFCRRICPYCDFAVVAGRTEEASRYVDALVAEIGMDESLGALDAVFIGGGTPSQLPPPLLARILSALKDKHGLRDDCEVSMEANPEDWSPVYAEEAIGAGVTRVSLGVQSFDAAVLQYLGRAHSPAEALEAIDLAKNSGLRSVNVDLIFGAPNESPASWRATVESAITSDVDHVSAYALTVERGTPLSRSVAGGASAPDDDDQADKWEWASVAFERAGLLRYEVSNFARSGHHCRYNLGTWGQAEYAGYGLGAHGHRSGVRTRNVRKLDVYLARVEEGVSPIQGEESLTPWNRELERLMLGLRRTAGVNPGRAGSRLLASPEGSRLVAAGILAHVEGRLVAADPLRTDSVIRAVLDLVES